MCCVCAEGGCVACCLDPCSMLLMLSWTDYGCGAAGLPERHQRIRGHRRHRAHRLVGLTSNFCEQSVVEKRKGMRGGGHGGVWHGRSFSSSRTHSSTCVCSCFSQLLPPSALSVSATQPQFADHYTLQLLRDGSAINAALTEATVPVGQTEFVYGSQEVLSIGQPVECSFTVC